jgi:hypothetical protein
MAAAGQRLPTPEERESIAIIHGAVLRARTDVLVLDVKALAQDLGHIRRRTEPLSPKLSRRVRQHIDALHAFPDLLPGYRVSFDWRSARRVAFIYRIPADVPADSHAAS